MNAAAKLAALTAGLAVLFAGGAAAGGLIDPEPPGGRPEARPPASTGSANATHDMGGAARSHMGERNAMSGGVRGLAVAESGLRLLIADTELRQDKTEQLRFRIVDDRGVAVREFDVEHTKRMHLILVRRDLAGFQHLHPTMSVDGTWTATVRVNAAGSYRVFADFSHDGERATLAGDLRVDGSADLGPLPAVAPVAESDGGYRVRLDSGTVRAGQESTLRFEASRNGRPVRVQPYLGADGHLVALRDGDLAFLHVHPADDRQRGVIAFDATFPTAGAYRLFLQFKDEGRVQTVAFTQEVR